MSESGDGTRGPGPHGFPFALDPATLQQMMQNLPPEVLNMMGPIQAAMSSEDPMAGVTKPDIPSLNGSTDATTQS